MHVVRCAFNLQQFARASYMRSIGVLCGIMAAVAASASPATDRLLSKIKLPSDFALEVLTDEVPDVRSLALDARGTVFVGTRAGDVVYAVTARANGQQPQVRVIARRLDSPNGLAFREGAMYIGEINRIIRPDGIEERLDKLPSPAQVTQLPAERHHGWRYMAFESSIAARRVVSQAITRT